MAVTRRRFAFSSVAALTAAQAARVQGANDRIRLGFIGVGNRGSNLMRFAAEFADQRTTAVCDVYDPVLDRAVERAGGDAARYKDYRRLLDDANVDAVVIATPDHWHALQTIHACRAGKDVYVEKPLSLTVAEGRRMVEVAGETERVVQVGIHRRSSPFCREATEIVRSGEIGPVTGVRCAALNNMWPHGIGAPPDEPPPEGLDWDLYLGPAPEAPYNENRHLFLYRWFSAFGGGQLTDNGVHFLDLIQWGLGERAPLTVTALGGKYAVEDNRDVPDTLEVLWEYPGGTLVSFTQSSCNAAPVSAAERFLAEFRGTRATLYVDFDGWRIVPEQIADAPMPGYGPLDRESIRRYRESLRPAMEARSNTGSADPRLHVRNFLDCVRSRETPNCDIETAHRSTTTANIGAIAHRERALLEWDPDAERFSNHEGANDRLSYEYREPWRLG